MSTEEDFEHGAGAQHRANRGSAALIGVRPAPRY